MTHDQHDKLDRFFRHDMSEEEMKLFQKDLESDSELRAEFSFRAMLADAFQGEEISALREKSKEDISLKNKPGKGRFRNLWGLAIAVLTVIFLSIFAWWMNGQFNKANDLFTKYNAISALYPDVEYALVNEGLWHKGMIGSEDFHKSKLDGLKAFKSGNWDAAIRLLAEYHDNAVPSEEEMPDEINLVKLYIGRAWLEKNEISKAIAYLQLADQGIVDTVNYGLLQELIRWQLTLAHLKNADFKSAKKMAEILGEAKHNTIKREANNLLNDLK